MRANRHQSKKQLNDSNAQEIIFFFFPLIHKDADLSFLEHSRHGDAEFPGEYLETKGFTGPPEIFGMHKRKQKSTNKRVLGTLNESVRTNGPGFRQKASIHVAMATCLRAGTVPFLRIDFSYNPFNSAVRPVFIYHSFLTTSLSG